MDTHKAQRVPKEYFVIQWGMGKYYQNNKTPMIRAGDKLVITFQIGRKMLQGSSNCRFELFFALPCIVEKKEKDLPEAENGGRTLKK